MQLCHCWFIVHPKLCSEDYVFITCQISGGVAPKEVFVWLSNSYRSDPYGLLFVASYDHFFHVCIPPKASVIGHYFLCCVSREVLRWAVFSMQAAGHILLGSSCYIEYLLQEEQTTQSLSLPQKSRIRQLQSMLLGRASQG